MKARVVALQLHQAHGKPLRPVGEVTARVGGGIEGDSHVDRPKRAVVIADRSTHEALGLRPGDLREQITVEGIPGMSLLAPDTEIRVGALTLRVVGECEPCTHIGEMVGAEDVEAFQRSLEGRRGAVCTVIAATGPLRIGDPVEVLPARVRV